MTGESPTPALYEELIRRLASAVRGAQLYAPAHPLVVRNTETFLELLHQLLKGHSSLTIGIVGREIVVSDTPLPKASASLGELMRRLQAARIERVTIERGVDVAQVEAFVQALAALATRPEHAGPGAPPFELPSLPHVRVGRLIGDERVDGISGDMATIRRLYNEAVQGAESVWDSAAAEGQPDMKVARGVVEGLAEAVAHNRTAVVALTAMRSYDNYTFTHMVNVSILAMGQARALGIEGRLLREVGLSALMHDIGKVRTPIEVLNKPEKLTDDEFAIMKRHVVDGAEILRQTPEMPVLAPVVAFEHHLRLDGAGYPEHASRTALNLGTMLCGIADVYDAMRSQRAYQQAFPTDRILAVLKHNDGRQFDQHLVRRFVQLIGIYPPGNLVRLSTGETAVVVQVHAPDPRRPRVRIIRRADGRPVDPPEERKLWTEVAGEMPAINIAAPLDPAEVGVDPLHFL